MLLLLVRLAARSKERWSSGKIEGTKGLIHVAGDEGTPIISPGEDSLSSTTSRTGIL